MYCYEIRGIISTETQRPRSIQIQFLYEQMIKQGEGRKVRNLPENDHMAYGQPLVDWLSDSVSLEYLGECDDVWASSLAGGAPSSVSAMTNFQLLVGSFTR